MTLDDASMVSTEPAPELVALDDALQALAIFDGPERAGWWSSGYFGGLSVEETAAALEVSADTVMRNWPVCANVWLRKEMKSRPRR